MPTDVRSILVRSARDQARRDGSRTIEAGVDRAALRARAVAALAAGTR